MEFVLGGTAATFAGLFTNPFDVIKTRQQLQGELVMKPNGAKMPYTTIKQAIRNIVKHEGIWGLQKGLPSALAFQFVMNSIRLGTYQTIDNHEWNRNSKGELIPILCILWGGISGICGSTVACPLYMIKTQIQASTHSKYAVGYQHHYRSTTNAILTIFKEGGIKSLWRGCTGLLTRTAVGSSVQLSTFSSCKGFLTKYEMFEESLFLTALYSSMVAGFYTSLFMTPFDTVATRMFNQGIGANNKGLLYSNIFDCFIKTFKTEGLNGLYKGFIPNYLRIAPHTILNLTFWEQLKKYKDLYYDSRIYFE